MEKSSAYKIPGTKVTSPYPVELTPAEIRLIFKLQNFFSPENIFPDCYFPKSVPNSSSKYQLSSEFSNLNQDLTQIDCIAINRQGIFVFESKDYSGWIYGNGQQRYWTQVLNFGQEKHQLYNPIRQNSSHLAALPNFETNPPIYSIIVFGRNAMLKTITNIPRNHFICTQPRIDQLLKDIISKSENTLTEIQLTNLRQTLLRSRVNPTLHLRQNHIDEVQTYKKLRNRYHD